MKKKPSVAIISLLLIGLIGVGGYFYLRQETKPVSQLTGEVVSGDEAKRPILGVVIENTPEARPQTGLNNAGIVFEAVTEGGITRYLALYQENQPKIVGPIRSLRVDTLDWAMGFDASFAHVGGRPEALDAAKERGAKTLSQFIYDAPYYRDDSRYAPHNMYAKTKGLRTLQKEQGYGQSTFGDIPRSDDEPAESPKASTVTIDYSGPDYLVEFRYSKDTNQYERYLADEPHTSSDASSPIAVKNLVVISLPAERTTDNGSLGEGKATVFKDGRAIEARWKKQNPSDRLKITDSDGKEIPLNRGKTWIAALQDDRNVEYN